MDSSGAVVAKDNGSSVDVMDSANGGNNGHASRRNEDDTTTTTGITAGAHFLYSMVLSLTFLSHSYLIISVFPYAGYMAMQLVPGVNAQSSGAYAGLISSSFMLGRVFTSYYWGKWADRYGRRSMLEISLFCGGILSLFFGLSTNFGVALFIRFLMGVSNGILGNTKTIMTEVAYGNKRLESRGMGMAIGMWGWAFLFTPIVSGSLSAPVQQYPHNPLVQQYHNLLSSYPFLLPNVVALLLCFGTLIALRCIVPETLENARNPAWIPHDTLQWIWSKRRRPQPQGEQLVLVEHNNNDSKPTEPYGSNGNAAEEDRANPPATIRSVWSNVSTRQHLWVYWMYAFITMAIDEGFPLFCIGGLGLSETEIGQILSVSGLVFAPAQYVVYGNVLHAFGLYNAIHVGTFFSCPLVVFLPLAFYWNTSTTSTTTVTTMGGRSIATTTTNLSWQAFGWLALVMAVERIFGMVFFSTVTMACNQTVPAHYRATMNGLATVGGSVAKGIGPALAGILVSVCLSLFPHNTVSAAMALFGTLSLIALAISVLSWFLLREPRRQQQQEQQIQ